MYIVIQVEGRKYVSFHFSEALLKQSKLATVCVLVSLLKSSAPAPFHLLHSLSTASFYVHLECYTGMHTYTHTH